MDYKHNPKLTSQAKQLRRDMTREERKLWYEFLRGYPVRILRQKVIDTYVVDFYCSKANLVIELDGSQHFEVKGAEYDCQRSKHLIQRGLDVIRIANSEVNSNFRGVCEYIDFEIQKRI